MFVDVVVDGAETTAAVVARLSQVGGLSAVTTMVTCEAILARFFFDVFALLLTSLRDPYRDFFFKVPLLFGTSCRLLLIHLIVSFKFRHKIVS